jgi:hypothetical protein
LIGPRKTTAPVTLVPLASASNSSYSGVLFALRRYRSGVPRGPGGGIPGRKAAYIASGHHRLHEPIDATQCSGKENCMAMRRSLYDSMIFKSPEQLYGRV